MSRLTIRLMGAAVGVCSLVSAQSGPLVGFTARPVPQSSNLTRQVICARPTTLCANAMPAPSQPWAGGAAYDPTRRSIWHTQGTRLQEIPLDDCKPTCSMAAARALTTSLVSGLTIDRSRNELYHVETIPGWAIVVTYEFGTAVCPRRKSVCRIQLPNNTYRSGAIALDRKRGVFYVAASVFNVANPGNVIYLYKRGSPTCDPICKLSVPLCLTGKLQAIRAMCYDECNDILYVSDGRQTSVQQIAWGRVCPKNKPIKCCATNHPQGEFWAGFDLQPHAGRSLGKSCTGRPCANCPNMKLVTTSDPVAGNLQFGFAIEQGPTGALGIVFLRIGNCHPGIPIGCGTFHALPPGFNLPPVVLNGVGNCGGSGTSPLPLPNAFGLCGLPLCAQGLIVCPGNPVGLGVTNAIELTIGS